MKRFRFGLDSVLEYRQQVLEGWKNEYAKSLTLVQEQQERVDDAQGRYAKTNSSFRERAAEGIAIADAIGFENSLRVLEQEIARELKVLRERESQAEKYRNLMIQAHMDASILERLKEKQKLAYQQEVQKQDEHFIDELVSAERAGQSEP